MRKILFLCTGNYYRSRFAELLFNAQAVKEHLDWWADSRGLALERGVNNVGPISQNAIQALIERGVTMPQVHRYPLSAKADDFDAADVIIALQQAEHQPYIHDRYPTWSDRVRYWHVHDVIPSREYDPLRQIGNEINRLILDLNRQVRPSAR